MDEVHEILGYSCHAGGTPASTWMQSSWGRGAASAPMGSQPCYQFCRKTRADLSKIMEVSNCELHTDLLDSSSLFHCFSHSTFSTQCSVNFSHNQYKHKSLKTVQMTQTKGCELMQSITVQIGVSFSSSINSVLLIQYHLLLSCIRRRMINSSSASAVPDKLLEAPCFCSSQWESDWFMYYTFR